MHLTAHRWGLRELISPSKVLRSKVNGCFRGILALMDFSLKSKLDPNSSAIANPFFECYLHSTQIALRIQSQKYRGHSR